MILPTATFTLALPSIVVNDGQTRFSPAHSIPTGLSFIRVEVDGSGWPAAAVVTIGVDYASDGVNFTDSAWMTTSLAEIQAHGNITPFIMREFSQAQNNASLQARAWIKSVGASINLVGNLLAG